jgi:hypothetical protein
MNQFSRMRNLATAYRTHLLSGNRDYRCRLAGERYELDLVSLMPWVNVDHRSNVPGLKPFLMEGRSQYHSVVFANHKPNILGGVSCDQPRKVRARVNNPDSPDGR